MARIAGVDLPREKRVEIGLTYIYGIGRTSSNRILEAANVDPSTRVRDLTDEEVKRISAVIDETQTVEGDLRREIALNIKRLQEIGCYRDVYKRQAKENAKILEAAVKDMEAITGQKAVTTKAKNAIANFKIRENMPIGCKVTLRGEKMYEFADRLINLALPRVRDFRGVNPNAFDGRGNYALGIKEQIIFPEIEYDKVDKVRGMDIIFVTTAKTDEEARELLAQFNMPFAK